MVYALSRLEDSSQPFRYILYLNFEGLKYKGIKVVSGRGSDYYSVRTDRGRTVNVLGVGLWMITVLRIQTMVLNLDVSESLKILRTF